MRERILEFVACPNCSGDLQQGDGDLVCATCRRRYPIRAGVPRFVEQGRHGSDTAETFSYEFSRLSDEADPVKKRGQDVVTFFRATGLDPRIYEHVDTAGKRVDLTPEDIDYEPDGSVLGGKLALDAGCGGGRFTRLLAGYGARVVALDISEAVSRVAVTTDPAMVAVVQADILHPPIRPGTFDLVVSIGVLHHTADTRRAILALARLLRPGGSLAVWVYGPDYWAGPVRERVTKAVRAVLLRLPVEARAGFCRHVLLPIGGLQMKLAKSRLTKWLFSPLFILNIPRHRDRGVMLATIFDYWSPPVIRTHTAAEVTRWFREAGLVDVRALPMPTAVTGVRPG